MCIRDRFYHNISNLNLTKTVTLPAIAQTAKVDGNIIKAVSYDDTEFSNNTLISTFTSPNGGEAFTEASNTKVAGFIFDFSIIDDFLFFEIGNSLYRYNLNIFTDPPSIFVTDSTPRGPFKKTLDGQMVNTQPQVFNARFEDFNNPFYTSSNHWTTIIPTEKVPFSLEAMANFTSTNTRFFGNDAYSTSDGKAYQEVGDFFGSTLKSDVVYLDLSLIHI